VNAVAAKSQTKSKQRIADQGEVKAMTNAITRVEIKDFLVFKGEFAANFCPGVNVLIGGNGSGKTTLLRKLYDDNNRLSIVYIPEKDILEHAKGLLPFIEGKPTGFSAIYKKVIVSAMDIPTNVQSDMQKSIGEKINAIIDGHIEWVQGEGSFYTIKNDGTRIPFANEASGYKKLGYLGLLVASRQLDSGSVLLWDEPENSLNPEIIPVLVDILLELQRGGVQVFVATHSYDIARWFEINKKDGDSLRYFNLRKIEGGITADVADDYTGLSDSTLRNAGDKLLKAVVKKSMGVDE
jgi:AAA15 family ATPase/GTPase